MAASRDEWQTAAETGSKASATTKPGYWFATFQPTTAWPRWAIYLARAKMRIDAERVIASTQPDCYLCARARGSVALAQGQFGRAAYWYRAAIASAPRLPAAYFDMGVLMMQRRHLDDAIADFDIAHRYGPHFADPLEMWGEALMLKNRSDPALAKFEEANRYAPNWGHLHLKWGQALFYSGRRDAARTQFRTASLLDLSVADRKELAGALKP
jgi:tetratricopeptide (TPR) repeat protein